MPEHAFTFPLHDGLHARPASFLQAVANRFAATVTLVNDRSGQSANAKSVLSMVGIDVRQGDRCRLTASGADEPAAIGALAAFVRDVLPGCDGPAAPAPAGSATDVPLPRSLVAAGPFRPLRGVAVSPGVGVGTVVAVGGWSVPEAVLARPAGTVDEERAAFADARRKLSAALSTKAAAATGAEAEVLQAHAAIAEDVALVERVNGDVAAGRSAVQAVAAAVEHYAATMAASPSEYLRERALDVRDVGGQLLQVLCGTADGGTARVVVLDGPSVVVAEALTPGQFLGLDRTHLRGLVLAHGGTTSHTVILARSMGVPTVVGVADTIPAGGSAVVDAHRALVVVNPGEGVRRFYDMEVARQARERHKLSGDRDRPGATADGRAIEVAANVASAEEVGPAVEHGAQGVGLFRTEMIFMDRSSAPTEDEQAEIYTRAAKAADGRPIIIRLLDAGGDKPVPYLNLPVEANPFLGYRAVRFYGDFAPLIQSQLRAVLRASAAGDVRIMVPMVSCVEETRAVRAMLAEAAASVGVTKLPPLGIMVEVPSVALAMAQMCAEVDFFSIGSNDLTQYLLAADRDNPKVAALYGWSHPALLRTLKLIVDGAHAKGKWVGLCGELGDVAAALPALVGLGLDEISVAGPRVPAVKRAIASLSYERCRAAVDAAVDAATRADAEAIIAGAAGGGGGAELPLLSLDLIDLDVDATTKAEAIKAVTDALAVAGRTADAAAVEEAVWQREETYSTGFGYGLAVPHCKTESVAASSVVVARLRTPIEWGSLDGNPVRVVILLAIRAKGTDTAKEHMRVFAKLSRMVMRDEFRDRLHTETDPGQLLAFLAASLEVPV
jgi:fructose-specific PTS system IIA-like component